MNQPTVEIGPYGALASLLAILASVITLTVWLVKTNMRRQEKVTDRTFTYMEKQIDTQAAIHTKHAEVGKIQAEAVQSLANSVQRNTEELRDIKLTVNRLGGKL